MPESLLSDYSAREITGEVLLYETRACLLAALGSHWTKSNKSTLCTVRERGRERRGGLGWKGEESLLENINVSKIRNISAVDLSYTSPVYDVGFTAFASLIKNDLM